MGSMKKRVLGLLLSFVMAASSGGQAWAVGYQPGGAPAPEEPTASEQGTQATDQTQVEGAESQAVPEFSQSEDTSIQGAQMLGLSIPSGEPAFPEHTLEGVSSAGTTIDLFDYWIVSQESGDQGTNLGTQFLSQGINNGHPLIFGKSMGQNTNGIGAWNQWTGGASPYAGIVASTLGADGYPRLNVTIDDTTAPQHVGKDGQESLAYLFDPKVESQGKESFADVRGLLQMDDQGYYHYDSRDNYAVYFEDTNSFVLYEYPGVQDVDGNRNGQFFPFNAVGPDNLPSSPGNYLFPQRKPEDANLNHYFGVHMTTRFVQQNQGYTDSSKTQAVTYQFSGDDDVWIFIDGILVADLGGIHDRATVNINFATGVISINGIAQGQSLGQLCQSGSDTLPDNTFHTLDFFYLERGNVESNMSLKFNLVSVPESAIIKVDQTGQPVPGAGFELYLADQSYRQQGTPIAADATDGRGQLVFLDENGDVISLQEIWTRMMVMGLLYRGPEGEMRGNLVLRESDKPEGYRSAGDVHLYLVDHNGHVLLLSDNCWDTGAYAYTNSTTVMNGQMTGSEGQSAHLDAGGVLFAVVLRRTTNVGVSVPSEEDTWGLVTGSAAEGWHTGQTLEGGQAGVEQVLEALHQAGNQGNYFAAQPDASGNYTLTVTDLPGNVTAYYYLLENAEKKNTEYTVGFYYTSASSVHNATSENTWRVGNSDTWSRIFSANVHVPNIKNRVFVQKVDPDGTTYLEGAQFTLYDENYYLPDGSVNPEATHQGTVTTRNLTKEGDGIQLEGAGMFPLPDRVLPNGTYYLVETAAPQGYDLNPTVSKIIVDDTGVYADAGVAEDGVVVARGVGSIVKSMAEFAAVGDVDATLTNLVARLYTLPSQAISGNGNFQNFIWRTVQGDTFVPTETVTYHPAYMYDPVTHTLERYDPDTSAGKTLMGMHMEYSAQAGLEYGVQEEIAQILGDQALAWMTTDTGWSKLMMEQCAQHLNTDTHVTDLTKPKLYDLTNLFSGTVVVQVTNQHTTSLTIHKQVQGVDSADVAHQTYTFQVEKLGPDGQTTDADDTQTVTVRVDGRDSVAAFQDGVLTVSRLGAGEIQVLDLDSGRYRVTETGYGAQQVGEKQWQSATYTSQSANVASAEGAAIATIDSGGATTATATVTVTNLYAGSQTLTVTKTVGGNRGDTSRNFHFTASLQDKNHGPYTGDITAIKTGAGLTQPETLTLTYEQNYAFTLKHGQQVVIQIPDGSKQVTVQEGRVAQYTTQSRSYPSTQTAPDYTPDTAVQTIASMDGGYTVDFYNECDLPAIPSGLASQSSAYLVMVGGAAGGALVVWGGPLRVWRRGRREGM